MGRGVDMKCPLLMMSLSIETDTCREEACAWWDEASERCAILMVAVDMDRAVSQVNDLCLTLNAQLSNLNDKVWKEKR